MKKILFVCVENSRRSQLAEGFANYYGKRILEADSAGSSPSGKIDPIAIEVMKEVEIDIASRKAKAFDQLSLRKFDYVITLGCRDICPFVPVDRHVEWEIEDPKDKDIQTFRRVRDTIKENVKKLIKDLSGEDIK